MRSIGMHIVNPTRIVSTMNISLKHVPPFVYTCCGKSASLRAGGRERERESARDRAAFIGITTCTEKLSLTNSLGVIPIRNRASANLQQFAPQKYPSAISRCALRFSEGEGERKREKMRPQHGETLRRLRSQVTSLANRAARCLPDTQSRLGAREDRLRRFLIALRTNLPSRKLTPARSTSRDRSLARFSLAEEDLKSVSRAPG